NRRLACSSRTERQQAGSLFATQARCLCYADVADESLQPDWMPGFEAVRHSLGRLPSWSPAAFRVMRRSGIETQSRDHRKGMAVAGVNRDPFSRTAAAVTAEFLRAHRQADEAGTGERIGDGARTIVGAIVKCLMPTTIAIRFGAQLIRGPDSALHGHWRVYRRRCQAIVQERGV